MGRPMTDGGNIIMPIDITIVATMRSMTRNGKATRNPISNPRRSYEIMKAGTKTVRATVRSFRSGV